MVKLTKNQSVAISVLEKICAELSYNIEDIMEFTELDEVNQEMLQKEEPSSEGI